MAVILDPRNLTWDYWCARTAEQFAAQQLGTLPEDRWQEWGMALSGIGYFTKSSVPDTRGFSKWQDWAFALTGAMTV
ncbi:MAG: hypothetical protein EBY28_22400 [Betaproteobacteria bacterium]|nr:hypothetical protein [Betaproteobacteria bacterium]